MPVVDLFAAPVFAFSGVARRDPAINMNAD
jgi:hypothetical protein